MEVATIEIIAFIIAILISQPLWNWYNNNYSKKRIMKNMVQQQLEISEKLDQVITELQKLNGTK